MKTPNHLQELSFGYIPYEIGAGSPGDRRRFPAFAEKLGLRWELYQSGREYDVIYVTSNADLTAFRRSSRDGKSKIVFEMVDSYLSVPDWEAKALIRGVGKWLFRRHRHLELSYRKTIAGMCKRADLVVCSTPEQRNQLRAFNKNVHDILDLHDELGEVARLGPVPGRRTIEIFWEGLALSASQFSLVSDVLRRLSREHPLRLHVVTDLRYKPVNAPIPPWDTRRMLERILPDVRFHLAEWNPATVRALAAQCDIGIIPLRLDKPLYSNKPENKLLIMWRLGLPVVTSATPAYRRTMEAYGGPNWSCNCQDDWYYHLREAISNTEARSAAGEAGQRYALKAAGTDALLERWRRALETLCASGD